MTEMNKKSTAAQVAAAEKAVELAVKASKSPQQPGAIECGLAPDTVVDQPDRTHAQGVRAPPARLLSKGEVCAIANVTFPTIWTWMRAGTFPRSRIVGGKSMWLSSEIDAWIADLPVRPLKGDPGKTGA